MAVDVKDLPPAYQAQALRKLMERERRKQRAPLPSPADAPTGGGNAPLFPAQTAVGRRKKPSITMCPQNV